MQYAETKLLHLLIQLLPRQFLVCGVCLPSIKSKVKYLPLHVKQVPIITLHSCVCINVEPQLMKIGLLIC